MPIDLYGCGCLWEEMDEAAEGGVKGYTLVSECDACRLNRTAVSKNVGDDATVEENVTAEVV